MTQTNTAPLQTIRDGALKATIWENPGEKGPYFSVRLSRSYRDSDGRWHDTDRFSNAELLRIARLAEIAYDEILVARGEHADPEANPPA